MPRDVLGGGADVQGIAVGPQGPSGNTELGSAVITANPAAATVSFVSVSGLSVTVTVAARPVEIKWHAGQVINGNTTASVGVFGLFRDGTEIAEASITLPAGLQFGGSGVVLIARDAPSAGSHTYDIRQKFGAAGQSVSILASATNPSRLSVNEV